MVGIQDWLVEVVDHDVPELEEQRRRLEPFLRDLGGVIVAGSTTETSALVRRYLDATAGSGSSVVLGDGRRVDPVSAALANSSSAQALDFDDIAPSCVSHLNAVMVPAMLAMSSRSPSAAELDGLLAGYCVVDRLAEVFTHEVYDRGFQPTHTLGSIGATVALLRALGAPPAVRSAAFGLLATQMIGLRSHTGTRYKPVQAGMVAAAAVRSVLLAEAGMTAGGDAIDVIMKVLGVTDEQLRHLTRAGELTPVPIAAKLYPTCGAAHTAIEATQLVRARLAPTDPLDARLHVVSPPRVMDALAFPNPLTPDQARFSMQYCVAVTWLTGQVRPSDFTPEALERPDVRKVASSVTVELDDALTPPPTWSGFPAVVTATTASGSATERVERPLGYPERPPSAAQWRDKFLVCTGPVLGEDRAAQAFEVLSGPDVLARMGDVLGGGRRS